MFALVYMHALGCLACVLRDAHATFPHTKTKMGSGACDMLAREPLTANGLGPQGGRVVGPAYVAVRVRVFVREALCLAILFDNRLNLALIPGPILHVSCTLEASQRRGRTRHLQYLAELI